MAVTIQGVYLALFGRPADPAGLAYFNGVTNNGANLNAIGDLANTAEYQTRFAGQTNEQIVNSIYQSLFERDAEPGGMTFFLTELAAGRLNINNIAIAILEAAKNEDLAIVNAKLAAADLFTASLDLDVEKAAYVGNAAAAIGRAYIADVEADDPATQAEADAAIELLLPDQGQEPEQPGGGGTDGGNVGLVLSLEQAVDRYPGNLPANFALDPNIVADLTVDELEDEVPPVIAAANNSAGYTFSYTLTDTFDELDNDANNAQLNAAQSYTLTDANGTNFGEQEVDDAELIAGATNGGNYSFVLRDTDNAVLGANAEAVAQASAVIADGSNQNVNETIDFSSFSRGVTINGNGGNDTITGSDFADTINGGSGADTINASAGSDDINGGSGSDTFVFADGTSVLTTTTNAQFPGTTFIFDFVGEDEIRVPLAGGSDVLIANGNAVVDFDALIELANDHFSGDADTDTDVYVSYDALNTNNAYVFHDSNTNGVFDLNSDTFFVLAGVDQANEIFQQDFF